MALVQNNRAPGAQIAWTHSNVLTSYSQATSTASSAGFGVVPPRRAKLLLHRSKQIIPTVSVGDMVAAITGSTALAATLTIAEALRASITGTPTIAPRLTIQEALRVSIVATPVIAARLALARTLSVVVTTVPALTIRLRDALALRTSLSSAPLINSDLTTSAAPPSSTPERTKTGSGT